MAPLPPPPSSAPASAFPPLPPAYSALHGKGVVLAYSGGLDTSFCAAFLSKGCGARVHAVCVDTGGFDAKKKEAIRSRALQYGASSFEFVDARADLFERHIRYLLYANALRGGTYPLCAGVERYVIAQSAVEAVRKRGASALAHGSTGAGNDQVRFDVSFGVLAPGVPVLTPVREFGLSRQAELDWLSANGFSAHFPKSEYSINEGLWGTTIGGKETKGSMGLPPESAYTKTTSISDAPDAGVEVLIGFDKGIPVSLDAGPAPPADDSGLKPLPAVSLIAQLDALAGAHGVGRGTHLGDTILGIKGRIAFEAPAPLALIAAHRELEKLVLTPWQAQLKDQAGQAYSSLVHQGLYHDPAGRDLEAHLASSQDWVSGTVRLRFHKGNLIVVGASSPHSLLSPKTAVYGEENRLWSGAEAAGFGKLWGLPSRLAAQAGPHAPTGDAGAVQNPSSKTSSMPPSKKKPL